MRQESLDHSSHWEEHQQQKAAWEEETLVAGCAEEAV